MRLYKFRTVDTYSLSALSNSKLWFSALSDFNDPFEGSHMLDSHLSNSDLNLIKEMVQWKPKEEVGEEAYEKMLSEMGINEEGLTNDKLFKSIAIHELDILINIIHASKICCFSVSDDEKDPLKENLMWSHYSNGLRGFCLVFNGDALQIDINNSSQQAIRAIQVKYQNKPNELKLSDYVKSESELNTAKNDYFQYITETIATKSLAWEYENEVRILALGDHNIHAYLPDTLLEIVVGEKMPEDQKNLVINTAKNANPSVSIKEARLKQNSYKLEIIDYEKK